MPTEDNAAMALDMALSTVVRLTLLWYTTVVSEREGKVGRVFSR